MTNPDNIVRVRARTGGRASVYEANGWCQAYTSGLVEGNGVIQNTSADMNVLVGGSASKPDVVLAENPSGYKIALDLVGQQAVAITAPASNSRISAIVAYTDDLSLSTTEDTVTGSPASCGLIVVNGTAASTPSDPTDAQIRTAITADGATGSQAAYCVIATILVANDTTIITNSEIAINDVTLAKTGVVKGTNVDMTSFAQAVVENMGAWETFLANTTSLVNYEYTVPDTYPVAEINIYIDASASEWTIDITSALSNTKTLHYSTANARSTFVSIVKAGDVLKVKRSSGSATAWHVGFIRRLF